MSQTINGSDFESTYFEDQQVERAKVRRASSFAQAVKDRLYGKGSSEHWTSTGFDKMAGKFDLRDGELTVWAGINKHGKTTFLANTTLHVIQRGKKVCIASMEMKPEETMAKMTKQAAGVENPSDRFIDDFAAWTDDRLWIYDHLGRLASSRVLSLAMYVRKELGIDHLVIDSLMKCGIGVEDLTGQKDFIDALCTICRDTGLHIHLVCHMRKGETEKSAPDKFSIKGAGEIADMPDNILIVCKNLQKADDFAKAEREKDPLKREALRKEANEKPDSFVRVAGQRNHPWEGTFAFWFDKGSQQFTESSWERPKYLDLELGVMR